MIDMDNIGIDVSISLLFREPSILIERWACTCGTITECLYIKMYLHDQLFWSFLNNLSREGKWN